ncbi:unnamed protein product [Adineta ricciae]|uniref:RBR-type E3 ubiquitin transferase n=1 Tax=Adineta ricciae TaxID=249248 RepID=A0A815HKU9_ADIRI|nr:unnamed protein product [Adineta ricciae]
MACALDPDLQSLENDDEAWETDLELIRALTREEKQAEEDRAFAARLAGIAVDPIPENTRRMAMLADNYDETVKRRVIVNKTTTELTSKPKTCAVCMEPVSKTDPRVPCGHAYCVGCLRELFLSSMQDETLMPPRCCRQEIPIHLAELNSKERKDFNAKNLEYSTTDRLYCSQPTCSTFIPATFIVDKIGTCPNLKCQMKTCAICKGVSHDDLECPRDEATTAVLAVAKQEGWTRCYRCRAVVELTQGCYHMTCRCRAEFCYLCSTAWKNCSCVQWDETRLLEEARVRTARIAHIEIHRNNERRNLEQYVTQMADELRNNHDCRHTAGWVYTSGGGRCEECRYYLPRYLFRCRRCHLMACNRCRHNRL